MKIFKKKKFSEKLTTAFDSENACGLFGVPFIKIDECPQEDSVTEGDGEHRCSKHTDGTTKNKAGIDHEAIQMIMKAEFADEDEPLTTEEKKIHYKSPKNVMAGRRIREMMNANVRAKLKHQFQEFKISSDYKTKLIVGLAVTLQVIPIILIFI